MEPRDHQRERIQDDLRGLVAGDVRCDEIFRQIYACDGSIHAVKPLGVVRPLGTADVVATVRYAAEKKIPLHARGAGTGSAGESLGPGLVIDFSKHLHHLWPAEGDAVRVQPGVVHERLNAYLRRRGRVFGPDPANTAVTTMGGVIAIDVAGSHWPKHGSTRRHVRRLQVVLADGHVIEAARESLVDGRSTDPDPRKRELVDQLTTILNANAALVSRHQPESPVNRCGYHLDGVLGDGYFDLVGLLVGSEGTLALTTEATLGVVPLARHRGVALLLFDSLEKASRAVPHIARHQPVACDLLDRRYLSLARDTESRFDVLIPRDTEAVLVVEFDGDHQREVRDGLQRLVDDMRHKRRFAFDARSAFDPAEIELFWQLATRIQPVLRRLEGASRPVPVVEDMAVPPDALPEFLVDVQNVLKRHQVTASLSSHTLQGQVHLQPFFDLANPAHVGKMRAVAEELYDEVFQRNGTIGGERGLGLSRSEFVARQYGELYGVFQRIKQVFDPDNLLNPGKIVGAEPGQLTQHLRGVVSVPREQPDASDAMETVQLRDLVELQLNWDPDRVAGPAAACNGCGDCRTQSADARMCPLFRILPAEESSPRAKAALIRAVLTDAMELGELTTDAFKQVADLCYHCHMCTLECPAQVDVPRLMTEAKGAYVSAKGLHFGDSVMNRLDVLGGAGSIAPRVANWSLGNRQMRWLMEKLLGVAQGRKLPRVAPRSFLRIAARKRLTKPRRHRDRKIAYFVDTYANFHDPQLAEALLAILKHNGIAVYVPPEQTQAGTATITSGALDLARRLARRNTTVLADAIRQGYDVVVTEPAAALSLQREYLYLLDDDDARLVADHCSEACAYLWNMHVKGKLQLDLKPINASIGYHLPCRMKALGVGTPGQNLLRLIPGLSVHSIEAGCCGMAGTFGLKRANYRTSLRIGWGLISALRDPKLQAGATECSACRIQMEQGTTKPTVHPIKLLALAYGLMPELGTLLTTPGDELVTT